ncbi:MULTISPECIES: iron uptake porin [Spirulina sp. CCY15215]|uniref:iron uptake porin n=1 Tax=Spirulina sp. CCY15215 TaxID=2767591 RepID=UPI00194E0CCE|nr:iron uptake porin [Spirulina major]
MDRQLWKLLLLKNPAVLGMALTLASTSAAIAIEPEITQDADKFSVELYDEILKNNEKTILAQEYSAIAKPPKSIQSEVLTNELFSESDRDEEIEVTRLEIDEFIPQQNIDNLDELSINDEDDRPLKSERQISEEVAEIESIETRETWPEFLTEADLKGDRSTANMSNEVIENKASLLDRINQYSSEAIGQNSFETSQFRDVSPGDWAFQALEDLVRRYDCLKGYPNGTYRGDRALTRYEFAAGLNACIQQVERLIAASTADFVSRQDLEAMQRLVQEFETELATLGTQVDNLESRVSFLENQQFSTTTKLSGEVIFGLTDNFDGGSSVTNNVLTVVSEAAFGNLARLELNTSFTGRDRLVTRLRAGNMQAYRSGALSFLNNTSSFAATQTFNVPDSESSNDVIVDWLGYYFPSGNSQAYVAATGGKWSDIAPTLNPYFEDFDGGNGSLSTFGQRNPIFRIGGGSGAAISLGFTPTEKLLGPSTITLGYFAGSNAATPGAGSGLFNGDYAAMGHLNVNMSDRLALGVTYVHGYHASGSPIYAEGRSRTNGLSGLVGSYPANNPWVFLDNSDGGIPMVTNSYGGEVSLRITDGLIVNGAMTYTNAILLERGNADIWSYSLGIALPGFFKEGDVWALYAGMQPTMKGIRGSGLDRGIGRTDPIWHLEGFYRFPITDNISITPGAVVVFNPNQNFSDHDDVIGTVRFTFSF